jgi:anti-sigma factor (TIGR02949 family)
MMVVESANKHEHKNCHQLLGSISEYLDGELDDELCAMLEEHLANCENCRIVVDTLKKTVFLYRTTAQAETLPGEVRERLFKSLNIQEFLDG